MRPGRRRAGARAPPGAAPGASGPRARPARRPRPRRRRRSAAARRPGRSSGRAPSATPRRPPGRAGWARSARAGRRPRRGPGDRRGPGGPSCGGAATAWGARPPAGPPRRPRRAGWRAAPRPRRPRGFRRPPGVRRSTAATRGRRSRSLTSMLTEMRARCSNAPRAMASAPPSASHAPVARVAPAATGGGSTSWVTTMSRTAAETAWAQPGVPGSPVAGRTSATTTTVSAATASRRSVSSKACHAVPPGSNQRTNSDARTTRAPAAWRIVPRSSLWRMPMPCPGRGGETRRPRGQAASTRRRSSARSRGSSNPHESRTRSGRHGRGRALHGPVRHGLRDLDQRLHAAERLGQREELGPGHEAPARRGAGSSPSAEAGPADVARPRVRPQGLDAASAGGRVRGHAQVHVRRPRWTRKQSKGPGTAPTAFCTKRSRSSQPSSLVRRPPDRVGVPPRYFVVECTRSRRRARAAAGWRASRRCCRRRRAGPARRGRRDDALDVDDVEGGFVGDSTQTRRVSGRSRRRRASRSVWSTRS